MTRVVVSGTHASGKSTLVSDLAAACAPAEVLPDPFELVDDAAAEPDASTFVEQMHVAAARLEEVSGPGRLVVAERGPLDLLAYLDALVELGRPTADPVAADDARETVARAMDGVDLVLVLDPDDVPEPEEEDPDLRAAMHEALLVLLDDPDLLGGATVVDVAGPRRSRLEQALRAIGEADSRRPGNVGPPT